MRRILAFAALCLTIVLSAASAFAGAEARLAGKVIDGSTRQPVGNALIRLDSVDSKKASQEAKGRSDGSYVMFVLDGTLRYKLTVTAPGYATFEEVVKLGIGDTNKKEIELVKSGSAPAAPQADPTAVLYNEGAQLANAGDAAAAVAKFQQVVAAKPDMAAAWMALAKTQLRLKNYAEAITAANKVLEIDSEDTDMWAVLAQAYTATGQKEKAAEASSKVPADAGTLFNQAAAAINSGKDANAEPLLKQAIQVDPTMAIAYYELGMVYVRSGNAAGAKENLQKYLELDPAGTNAATAKEMLGYLK